MLLEKNQIFDVITHLEEASRKKEVAEGMICTHIREPLTKKFVGRCFYANNYHWKIVSVSPEIYFWSCGPRFDLIVHSVRSTDVGLSAYQKKKLAKATVDLETKGRTSLTSSNDTRKNLWMSKRYELDFDLVYSLENMNLNLFGL